MNVDSPQLFSIQASDAVTNKLRTQIQNSFKKNLSINAGYQESWKSAMETGAKKLKSADYWQFRLLHGQFHGVGVLGLPSLVRAARFVIKKIKSVKG